MRATAISTGAPERGYRLACGVVLTLMLGAVAWVAAGYSLGIGPSLRELGGGAAPTEGLTRGVRAWLHGSWTAAAAQHPGAPWVGLWIALQLVWRSAQLLRPWAARLWAWDLGLSLGLLVAAMFLPVVAMAA